MERTIRSSVIQKCFNTLELLSLIVADFHHLTLIYLNPIMLGKVAFEEAFALPRKLDSCLMQYFNR